MSYLPISTKNGVPWAGHPASANIGVSEIIEAVKMDVLHHIHNRRETSWAEFVEEKRRKVESGD